MLKNHDLSGEWMLKAFNITKPNGHTLPWREKSHGLLIYTMTGYMSVSINGQTFHKDKTSLEHGENAILFYSGTYEIKNNKIVHYVSNASDPDRIGKQMIRDAALNDQELTLTAKGDYGTATLIWKRMIGANSPQKLT